jgi:hypothetical protein
MIDIPGEITFNGHTPLIDIIEKKENQIRLLEIHLQKAGERSARNERRADWLAVFVPVLFAGCVYFAYLALRFSQGCGS